MAILIANIGTSDLAVKIDGFDYYLPICERNEPNEDNSELTDDEREIWTNRNRYIAEILWTELNVPVNKTERNGETYFNSRNLTEKLFNAYKQDRDTWHSRIRPGRIGGAIVDAKKKFQAQTVRIFVTNQEPQHKDDTLYLFEILKLWFSYEIPDLNLIQEVIPTEIPANNQDLLLDHYYDFFNDFCKKNIDTNSTLLISIKGGTPQMQTALKMQAIASSVPRLLFIDPQLSISKTLAGEFSVCQLNPYWRYMRTQKYQTAKLLLEKRWDFTGAMEILADWKKVLKFLLDHQVMDNKNISSSNEAISRVIKTLQIGIDCFNLDIQNSQKFFQDNPRLNLSQNLVNEVTSYDRLLNLYTQCRIYWELDEVANFLARMSSFYEEFLYQIARKLDGGKYFQGRLENWNLDTNVMGETFWEDFNNLEWDNNPRMRNHNFANNPIFQLSGRPTKRNFVDVLVRYRNHPQEVEAWEKVLVLLKSLDFWATQRNKLIHSADGVSKGRMRELFLENSQTCRPNQILEVMTGILNSDLGIIRDAYRKRFVGENAHHYIYSEVKDWVINTLLNEGLV